MNFYQEMTIIPQTEISPYFIWSKLYKQLHFAFVEQKDGNQVPFGVSFPEYHFNEQKQFGALGTKIRVFSQNREDLETLNLSKWLDRLLDYVHITSIREVPKSVAKYAVYSKKQIKGAKRIEDITNQRANYYSEKHHVSLEEAKNKLEKRSVEPIFLPFIRIESTSTKQFFRLFIEKRSKTEKSEQSIFSTYGLSTESTVPEF